MKRKIVFTIIVVPCVIALLLLVNYAFFKPKITYSGHADTSVNQANPIIMYTLGKTTVCVTKGDILNFTEVRGLKLSNEHKIELGLAISVKCNLNNPFHDDPTNNSLDVQLRQRFNNNAGFNNDIEFLKRKHLKDCQTPEDYWIDILKNTKINSTSILYFAGVEAIASTGEESKVLKYNKPRKILKGISTLCSFAANNKISHLAIPIIGTGAGGMDIDEAIFYSLRGINNTAVYGNAPPYVILFLWPKGKNNVEKNDWFINRCNVINGYIQDKGNLIDNDTDLNIWGFNYPIIITVQILILILGPCISALIFIKREGSNNRLNNSVVIGNIVKWGLITSGFFSLSQETVGFSKPLNASMLLIMFCASIILTLWEWYKMGEIPDK